MWKKNATQRATQCQGHSRFLHSLAVSSGSITINDDSSVQILAEEAARLDDLDREVSFTVKQED